MTRLEYACDQLARFQKAHGHVPGSCRVHPEFIRQLVAEVPGSVAGWVGDRGVGDFFVMGFKAFRTHEVHSIEWDKI